MGREDDFDRIVASLHEAMLDEKHWRATSALIDRACGMKGNHLVIATGSSEADAEFLFGELWYRGESRPEIERDYVEYYFPRDPRIPHLFQLPDARPAHMRDLYTDRELKRTEVYNHQLRLAEAQNGLNIRMDGPEGLHIVWVLADPAESGGWDSERVRTIERLLPHIRQFVRVRHALVGAEALGASLAGLLDNQTVGVIYLDARGRIFEINDRARAILRQGDGLTDRGGVLRARLAVDDAKLGRLLARVLSRRGAPAVAGSMMVERLAARRFSLHVCPVATHGTSFGTGRVAAMVLIVDPAARLHIDPGRTAALLGLTRSEGRVAASLAEGASVRDIVAATHRAESTVRWTVKRIHAKLGITRQADLVRMVLSATGVPEPRLQPPESGQAG